MGGKQNQEEHPLNNACNTDEQSLNTGSQNQSECNVQAASVETESASSVLGESSNINLTRNSSEQNVNMNLENDTETLQSNSAIAPVINLSTENIQQPTSNVSTPPQNNQTVEEDDDMIDENIKPIGYHCPISVNNHYYPFDYNELEEDEKDMFTSLKGPTCIPPEGALFYILCFMIYFVIGCFFGYLTSSENTMQNIDLLCFGSFIFVIGLWCSFQDFVVHPAQRFPDTKPVKFTYYEEIYMP